MALTTFFNLQLPTERIVCIHICTTNTHLNYHIILKILFSICCTKRGGSEGEEEEGGEEGGKVNYLKSCHQQRLVCKTHTCRALPKQMREEHSFIPPSSPLFSSQHSRVMIVKSLSCVKKINRTAQGVFPHSTKENSRTWIPCMGRSGVQAAQILVS